MKGILWDLDGTLLNTLTDLAASVNFALRSLGFPERTVEEVRRFVGNGAARLITLALPEEGKAHFDEAFELFREHYAHHSDDAAVVIFVRAVIQQLYIFFAAEGRNDALHFLQVTPFAEIRYTFHNAVHKQTFFLFALQRCKTVADSV